MIDALPEELTYPDSTALWENILQQMAEGSQSLEEFLRRQAEYTVEICARATGLRFALKGDYPCQRCGNGVLQPRNGKNGKFWGCSQYPACRNSCNDKDGAPDLPLQPARAGG